MTQEQKRDARTNQTNRKITFGVDGAASRTVVLADHPACWGYRVYDDNQKGQTYGMAKKNGLKITDERLRVLQAKVNEGCAPRLLRTRMASVHRPFYVSETL